MRLASIVLGRLAPQKQAVAKIASLRREPRRFGETFNCHHVLLCSPRPAMQENASMQTAHYSALEAKHAVLDRQIADETRFDPGAKYHVPASVPYTRYFLARLLQFQFYQAACKQAGWRGPLHRCSFYGNKEVGAKLNAMLAMGQSKPWPDALQAFTGSREMSGQAMVDYFAPLKAWLDKQNKGHASGCAFELPVPATLLREPVRVEIVTDGSVETPPDRFRVTGVSVTRGASLESVQADIDK
eukprot:gene5853-7926_t